MDTLNQRVVYGSLLDSLNMLNVERHNKSMAQR